MSGVCAKHHGYVQPGEVCPYCEPSCDFVVFAGNLAQLHPAPPMIDLLGARVSDRQAHARQWMTGRPSDEEGP